MLTCGSEVDCFEKAVKRATATDPTGSARSGCPCGQTWSDPKVAHFCRLIETLEGSDIVVARAPNPTAKFGATPSASSGGRVSISPETIEPKKTEVAVAMDTAANPSGGPRKAPASENIQVFIRIRPPVDRELALQESASSGASPSIRALDTKVGASH